MLSTRATVAGAVSLVVGGGAIVLPYLVTPLSGDVSSSELFDKVTVSHAERSIKRLGVLW